MVKDVVYGLADLEQALGIAPVGEESARIRAVLAELARSLSEWELMANKQLIQRSDRIRATYYAIGYAEINAKIRKVSSPRSRLLLNAMGIELRDRLMDQAIRENDARTLRELGAADRRRGGLTRAANDPKRPAKEAVFKFWKERYHGKHPTLRTNEQFALECLRRWPILTSAKTIVGWCTNWSKEAKGKTPAS